MEGAFCCSVQLTKHPETRGGILELQLGYRPESTIQEQGCRKHLSLKKEMINQLLLIIIMNVKYDNKSSILLL